MPRLPLWRLSRLPAAALGLAIVSARCLDAITKLALPPTQKSILRALAWRANGSFRVKATFRELRADTGYGDSSVRRETEMLVSLGYLSLVEATRGPGAYVVWDIVPPAGTAIMSSNAETVPPAGTASPEYRPEVPVLPRRRVSTPQTLPLLPEIDSEGESEGEPISTTASETLRLLSEVKMPKPRKGIRADDSALVEYWRRRYQKAFRLSPEKADSRAHDEALGFVAKGNHAKKFTDLRRAFQKWIANDIRFTEERREGRQRNSLRPVGPATVGGAYTRLRAAGPEPE